MNYLRKFLLILLDTTINLVVYFRTKLSFNKSNLPSSNEDLKIKDFFPYDLVIKTTDLDKSLDFLYDLVEIGDLYKVGTVIGLKGETYGKVKVAFFNTAELGVPRIEYIDKASLTLLLPSMQSLTQYMSIASLMGESLKANENFDLEDFPEPEDDPDKNGGGNLIH